jgi:hypothetical protein
MTKLFEYKKYRASIGIMSLVGVSGTPPHLFGNYFGLADGPRVVNFWAENLKAAKSRFLSDGMVRVRQYTEGQKKWVLIDDDRIPSDWYYDKLCFTGSIRPPIEILEDMYKFHGDPNFELEKYTDPVSYYNKRGMDCRIHPNGLMTIAYRGESRKLMCDYTLEMKK